MSEILFNSSLEVRFDTVLHRMQKAEQASGRSPGSTKLIAVSKTQPAEAIRALFALGQSDFGENYLNEALSKQEVLRDLDLVWHFIGPIQSNKTSGIALHFDWVHSVDRLRIAERLSQQRPKDRPDLNICIQVNVSGENSKSGVTFEGLTDLATGLVSLPRLKLRGLMAIPEPGLSIENQHQSFKKLREAMLALPFEGLDTLSMGMSDDLEIAISEGSSMVRIGTSLFGTRLSKA